MNELLTVIVILVAGCVQAISGFGLALVTMPILTEFIEIKQAASLVALTCIITNLMIVIRYRVHFEFKLIVRLLMTSILAIPIGMITVAYLNSELVLRGLGIVVFLYALWDLLKFKLPQLKSPLWAYPFGFLSGLLAGSYSMAGPPLIVYGNCCRWKPAVFKTTLNSFFLINTAVVILSHYIQRHYTIEVMKLFLYALPSLFIGMELGVYLSTHINSFRFRQIVLLLLILLSIKLMI